MTDFLTRTFNELFERHIRWDARSWLICLGDPEYSKPVKDGVTLEWIPVKHTYELEHTTHFDLRMVLPDFYEKCPFQMVYLVREPSVRCILRNERLTMIFRIDIAIKPVGVTQETSSKTELKRFLDEVKRDPNARIVKDPFNVDIHKVDD
jgi:hypothetical protein